MVSRIITVATSGSPLLFQGVTTSENVVNSKLERRNFSNPESERMNVVNNRKMIERWNKPRHLIVSMNFLSPQFVE